MTLSLVAAGRSPQPATERASGLVSSSSVHLYPIFLQEHDVDHLEQHSHHTWTGINQQNWREPVISVISLRNQVDNNAEMTEITVNSAGIVSNQLANQ